MTRSSVHCLRRAYMAMVIINRTVSLRFRPKAIHAAKGAITIGFRPEALRVGEGPLKAQVRTAEDLGSEVFVHVAVDHLGESVPLVSKMQPPFTAEPGENVALQITGTTHVFDGEGHRIASGPATLR